jgi:hypothetical protein
MPWYENKVTFRNVPMTGTKNKVTLFCNKVTLIIEQANQIFSPLGGF